MARNPLRRWGFTLTETLLSLTLLGLVLVFILNIFPSSMATVRSAEQRYRAETLAGSFLEQQMAVPFDQLPVGLNKNLGSQVFDQVEYGSLLEVLAADGDPQYLRAVRVTVSWTLRKRTHQTVRELWIHRLPSQL